MGDDVTGLRLKLADMFAAPRVVRDLALALGGGYYVDDWTRKHANFFRSIQLTKSALFIILLLVVGVAAFNIVSTLVMVVKDKQLGYRDPAHHRRHAAQHPRDLHDAGTSPSA